MGVQLCQGARVASVIGRQAVDNARLVQRLVAVPERRGQGGGEAAAGDAQEVASGRMQPARAARAGRRAAWSARARRAGPTPRPAPAAGRTWDRLCTAESDHEVRIGQAQASRMAQFDAPFVRDDDRGRERPRRHAAGRAGPGAPGSGAHTRRSGRCRQVCRTAEPSVPRRAEHGPDGLALCAIRVQPLRAREAAARR
jgi:hypothetical protein